LITNKFLEKLPTKAATVQSHIAGRGATIKRDGIFSAQQQKSKCGQAD
jgi:hypothetical protein